MNGTPCDSLPALPKDACQKPHSPLCPLSRIRAGSAGRIKRLTTEPELSLRLREIGFIEEQIVKLVTCRANFICQICEARLAISSDLAERIWVEPVARCG